MLVPADSIVSGSSGTECSGTFTIQTSQKSVESIWLWNHLSEIILHHVLSRIHQEREYVLCCKTFFKSKTQSRAAQCVGLMIRKYRKTSPTQRHICWFHAVYTNTREQIRRTQQFTKFVWTGCFCPLFNRWLKSGLEWITIDDFVDHWSGFKITICWFIDQTSETNEINRVLLFVFSSTDIHIYGPPTCWLICCCDRWPAPPASSNNQFTQASNQANGTWTCQECFSQVWVVRTNAWISGAIFSLCALTDLVTFCEFPH